MSPPDRQDVSQIYKEVSIHCSTLYKWRSNWRLLGEAVPASEKDPDSWSAADKFTVVLETAGFNATELSSYCRERGLFLEQVDRWSQTALDANAVLTMAKQRDLEKRHQQDQKEIQPQASAQRLRGTTLEVRLEELGVLRSFSRLRVSNDNPYSKSLFRAVKYRPYYPNRPFSNIEEACQWVSSFVDCYNHQHRHSGGAIAICKKRTDLYKQAGLANPKRCSKSIRFWKQPDMIWINSPADDLTVMSISSLIENDPLDLDPRIGKSAGIGTDPNTSEYGTVTLKCVGLQELSKNGPNFVLRLQYNRVLTTAEAMAIVDALQAQEGFSSSSILFNENIVSAGGYSGAGFDINATYIKLKYSGENDTIAIDLPSDVVFLEWQIFSSPSSTVQPTFSGGDYFVFQDANGQDIANYPLEPGNRSLKSYGLLKSQKPSVDVNNFYSLVPTDSAQKGSTFKIDEETSSSNFLSGSKDKDGCNISYLLGVTAIQENQDWYGIPNIDHLAPYTSIQVKVDKSLIDGVFDPYLDRIVPLYSPANYISIGFHTIGQAVQSNTWDYGVSAHDIKQLGSNDDFYYVYFTTSPDVYEAAMAASGYPVYERPVYPPIVSPDGQRQKGYLLYNGNSSDLQGAMLMRIRNGNYTNADLEEFLAAPCYDTADENQPFVNGWVVFSTLDSSVRIRNTIYVSTSGQVITTRMTPTSGSIEGDVSFNRLAAAPTFTNQKAGLVIGQTGINFSLKLDQSSNGNTAKTAVDLAPLFDGLSTTNKRLAYFVYDSPVVGAPPVATPFTYDPTQKAGARFYDLDGNGSAHTADLQFIDGGYGDKDGKKNGVVVNPSTAGVVDLNAIFTASANSLTVADPTDSTSPAALTVRATLTAKAASVNQIGFVAFNANEADTLTYELVRDRGTILLANLESSDTPNVTGMKFQRDINLINGQKLVFFEVVDTTLESLLAKNTTLQGFGSSFRTLDLSKSTDTAATASKGGNTVALSLLNESAIAGLGDLISSQMADTPILDFTGLAGRTLEGSTVSLAREANYDTTIGFYRIQRADGAVLDPITNTLITPGSAGYKAAALSSTNLFNGFGTLAVANGATRTDTIAAFNESGLLAPYATVAQTGDTFFSFRSANSDNLNHFRVLGSGVIGLEDLNGGGDQDFDDNIVSFNFKLKQGTVA